MRNKATNTEIEKFLPWILFIILSLIWGSSFILIKKSLVAFSPIQVAGLRIFITAFLFSPWIYRSLKKIKRSDLKYVLIVGLTGSAFPAFLYALAQTQIASSIAGVLNSMTPIFTLLFAALIFSHKKLPISQVIGVVLGFIGAAFLVLYGDSSGLSFSFWPVLILLATMLYGLSGNIVEHKLHTYDSMTVGAASFGLIGGLGFIVLLTTPIVDTLNTHPDAMMSLLAVSVLALTSTFLATILFYMMLKMSDAVFASAVTYFIPVVALIWGLFDQESISIWYGVSLVVILLGLYLIRRGSIKTNEEVAE